MGCRVCSMKPFPVYEVDAEGHAGQQAIQDLRRLGEGLGTKLAGVFSLFAVYVDVEHDPR